MLLTGNIAPGNSLFQSGNLDCILANDPRKDCFVSNAGGLVFSVFDFCAELFLLSLHIVVSTFWRITAIFLSFFVSVIANLNLIYQF